jgi:hypothetical protein
MSSSKFTDSQKSFSKSTYSLIVHILKFKNPKLVEYQMMLQITLYDDLLYRNFVHAQNLKMLYYHQCLGVRWVGNINEF